MSEFYIPPHKCGLTLTHNEHKNNYETALVAIEDQPDYYTDASFASPEERERCIEADEIWTLHWYPDTPVGFYKMHASTLEALNAAVRAEFPPALLPANQGGDK